jgi:hypothetical protein
MTHILGNQSQFPFCTRFGFPFCTRFAFHILDFHFVQDLHFSQHQRENIYFHGFPFYFHFLWVLMRLSLGSCAAYGTRDSTQDPLSSFIIYFKEPI